MRQTKKCLIYWRKTWATMKVRSNKNRNKS
jgi:hypothetical protein